MAHAVGIGDCPLHRLHPAETAAHYRSELADAEQVGQPRLRFHPVLHRHHRKAGTILFAGSGVDARRAGRAMTAAEVVQPDNEELVGIHRLAGTDHVVPPPDVLFIVRVITGDVMMPRQRVADEDGVGPLRVQRAICFVHQVVARQHSATVEVQRRVESGALSADDAYRIAQVNSKNKTRTAFS